MAERVADYEWRGDGEDAEVILYAPDASSFEHALPAARLPGVESPVYAAASPQGFGCAAASTTHAAPDLASAPARGLLLTADRTLEDLGAPPEDVPRLTSRNLSEVGLPSLSDAGVRRICESGAYAAAEDGLIEEDDLPLFGLRNGESDALGRRAISSGARDWKSRPEQLDFRSVGEVLDAESAEFLGLGEGTLALVVRAGAGELGRVSLADHRERILERVRFEDIGAEEDLPAAPADTEDAEDLLMAFRAAAGFADGRAALLVYALRRALEGVAGELSLRVAWGLGGIEEQDGLLVHRRNLAAAASGKVLVSGGDVASGTGGMLGSAPSFWVAEEDGRWPWEEAGLLERAARLERLGS